MKTMHELFVSAGDAEAIALMLGEHRRTQSMRPDASDHLADLLLDARLVAAEKLPADRVALHSTVTYRERPSGIERCVTVVLPEAANASDGRISLLTPIGLALIGRRRGDVVHARLPGKRTLEIHIVDTHAERAPLRAAA